MHKTHQTFLPDSRITGRFSWGLCTGLFFPPLLRAALWMMTAVLSAGASLYPTTDACASTQGSAGQDADPPDAARSAALAELDASLSENNVQAAVTPATSVHGLAMLGFKQTFAELGNFETLMLQVEVDHRGRNWGIYVLPRLKISGFDKIIAGSTLWLHQGYVYSKQPWGEVKVGKVLSAFGRAWDYGLYGPLLANNDVKLAPDIGASVETQTAITRHFDVASVAQYAPIDGRAVAIGHGQALRFNRRREHILTLKLAPQWQPAAGNHIALELSGQRFTAVQVGNSQVLRAAAGIEGGWQDLGAFVELGTQQGDDRVVQHDILVHSHRYIWAGAQYARGPISLRYHFNALAYDDDTQTKEVLHQPGIAFYAGEHCTFVAEMALWHTSRPLLGRGEKTLYLLAGGSF